MQKKALLVEIIFFGKNSSGTKKMTLVDRIFFPKRKESWTVKIFHPIR